LASVYYSRQATVSYGNWEGGKFAIGVTLDADTNDEVAERYQEAKAIVDELYQQEIEYHVDIKKKRLAKQKGSSK
jgi:hypothetical protein